MEARTHLQQGSDAAPCLDQTCRWSRYPRQELEQRALACTVLTDDAHDIALLYREVDVLQRPHIVAMALMGTVVGLTNLQIRVFFVEDIHRPPAIQVMTNRTSRDKTQPVLFSYVLEFYCFHKKISIIRYP